MDPKSGTIFVAVAVAAVVGAMAFAMVMDDNSDDSEIIGTWNNAYTEGYYATGEYYAGETVNVFPLVISWCSDTQFSGYYNGEPIIGTIDGIILNFSIVDDVSSKLFVLDASSAADGLLYASVFTNTEDGFEAWYDSYVKEGSSADPSERTAVSISDMHWDLKKGLTYQMDGSILETTETGHSFTFTDVRDNVAKFTSVGYYGTLEGMAVLKQSPDGTVIVGTVCAVYNGYMGSMDLLIKDGVLNIEFAEYSIGSDHQVAIDNISYTTGASVPDKTGPALVGTIWAGAMTTMDIDGNVTTSDVDYRLVFDHGTANLFCGSLSTEDGCRVVASTANVGEYIHLNAAATYEDSLTIYSGFFNKDMDRLVLTGTTYDGDGAVLEINSLDLVLWSGN